MFLNIIAEERTKIYRERRLADAYQFVDLFRFNSEEVDWLVEEFLPENNESRGGCLNNRHKMLCFLRYMSDPGFQV